MLDNARLLDSFEFLETNGENRTKKQKILLHVCGSSKLEARHAKKGGNTATLSHR